MNTVGYVLRDSAGNVARGALEGANPELSIPAASQVSLNVSTLDVQGYSRDGADLILTLADGREITLSGYFDAGAGAESRLYLSENGLLTEIDLAPGVGDTLNFGYRDAGNWGKWSPDDALIFAPDGIVADPAEVGQGVGLGLLGMVPGALGMGAAGAAAVGATALGAAAIAGGSGDGGGDGGGPRGPSVDDTPIAVGGDDPAGHTFAVTGTAEPGSTSQVTVGGQTQTVTTGDDGTWICTFEGESFPPDGDFPTTVIITPPEGDPVELPGPPVLVDTTPPDLAVTSGTSETGDFFNAVAFPGGVILSGTGEPRADLSVTVNGQTQQTVIGDDGTWSVTFTGLAEGDYSTGAILVASDAMRNTTTINASVVIDTVPAPIAFATVEGDNIVNGVEVADGVTLSGTSEAGASMVLTWGGIGRTLTVADDGTWSASYTTAELTAMDGATQVSATVTDMHGNTSTGTHDVLIDRTTSVAFDAVPFAGDDMVNQTEAAAGVQITGTAEPGATVVLSLAGQQIPATVQPDGSWSALVPGTAFPSGDSATFTVTATDAAGNTAQATRTIQLDLTTTITIDTASVGGDGTVNAAEQATGMTLTGTAEPNASVEVTANGATRIVTADSAGVWSATFTPVEVPVGTIGLPVSATATDTAGNTASTIGTVNIDTETAVTLDPVLAGGDSVVNAAEAAAGLTLTGTAESAATVLVSLGGTSRSVTATEAGTWAATFAAAEVPSGTTTLPVTVTSTDTAGNTATAAGTVAFDTEVTPLTSNAASVEGDGTINAAEATNGFTLTGMVETGSTVMVAFDGMPARAATVDGGGSWQVAFSAAEIRDGAYEAPLQITATDAAGNTRTLSETVTVDTDAPEAPFVASFTKGHDGVRSIGTQSTTDTLDIAQVDGAGNVRDVRYTTSENGRGETVFEFSQSIPDGSHLVITRADAAGNATGTLFVLEDNATSNVDLSNPGFDQFDIAAIDLTFATDSRLTITEAQLKSLSSGTDEVVIHGGIDDHVTAPGARDTGQNTPVQTQMHDVYSLGTDGAQLIIDDEITVFP